MKLSYRDRITLIALLLALSTLFASCNFLPANNAVTNPVETTTAETTPIDDSNEESTPNTTTPEESTPKETTPEITSPEVTTPEETTPEVTTPEITTPEETTPEITTPGEHYPGVPAFSGEKYVEVNGNVPYFTEKDYTTTSYEYYSPLDSLGRCGIAMACLGRDLMPTGTRGDLSTNPSGWMQASYDIVDGRYLYNRSHLIGWQLAGEDDNKLNLITGTRFCNQLGMLPFENMVADYIKETGNHVLYRVTPLFIGNELVARGVLMEAWSVEDNGDGI